MKSARQCAFDVLHKVQQHGAYSNLALDAGLSAYTLEERDRALASALVYTTLEKQITLDYTLSLYLQQPIQKLKPQVRIALRLGVCQLLFFDKIPPSAAVNSSVALAKANHAAFAAGLVNAVLRKVSQSGLRLPDPAKDFSLYRQVAYACPAWLLELWDTAYGPSVTQAILEDAARPTPVFIRVNHQKTSTGALLKQLLDAGFDAKEEPLAPNCIRLQKPGSLEKISAFRDGLFHVQDLSSQLCCLAANVQPGNTVLDLCAAPGGKAVSLATDCAPDGQVHAFDLFENRLPLINQTAERLGLRNITVRQADAAVFEPSVPQADFVLCDVPCSGLGIVRRKPEIRFKTPADIDKLPVLQYRILCNALRYLKPGGRLVYSTCTLNPAENEEVAAKFLAEHPEMQSESVLPQVRRLPGQPEIGLTLFPHLHGSDGFFMAAFRRTEG